MEQLYKTANYKVWALLHFLDNWDIWLPDLQRPFVWSTSQVRDLFDSLYRWYPVGFFLLWEIKNPTHTHSIWSNKSHWANRVVIDGQQRLTALYSVIKWERVKDVYGSWIKIKLAFNPITNKVEVSTPAYERSHEWIPNITELWTRDYNNDDKIKELPLYENKNELWSWSMFDLIDNYFERFEESNVELTKEDKRNIKNNIKKLYEIQNFDFTALEISSDVSIEEISDIFVRINSKWKQLSQADFILTLLSVYWDEWRKEIESFCYEKKNPFNYLLNPLPDDIIKVLVSFTFFKWRLKDMYNLLRWRDTETRKFDDNLKKERLEILKVNLDYVLDPTNWASFFKILIWLWFKSRRLINSDNNVLFTYITFLIWKYKFKLEYDVLEKYIWKYYVFSILTAKYGTSTESTLEEELKKIQSFTKSDELLSFIDAQINLKMWEDFWSNAVIDDLTSSYIKNNVYMVYVASKIYSNMRILFSNNLLWDLINDELTFKKELLDKHHIFPKNYLDTYSWITDIKVTNQVANIVYLGYNDNIKISDKSPGEYYNEMVDKYGKAKVDKWLIDNDIPLKFYELTYDEFLVERRKLMVNSIRKYFESISTGWIIEEEKLEDIKSIIEYWESNEVEFKSTLRWDIREWCVSKKMEFVISKTISAFLNSNGWTLYIWVEDNWNIYWLEKDYSTLPKKDSDWFLLQMDNLIDNTLWKELHKFIGTTIEKIDWKDIAVIKVAKSNKPVFLTFEWKELFFLRAWSSTRPMTMKEFNEYKEVNW